MEIETTSNKLSNLVKNLRAYFNTSPLNEKKPYLQGFSRTEMKKSINAQNKIEPANLPKTMVSHVLVLFRKNTPLVQ